jgi:hypothetical protein
MCVAEIIGFVTLQWNILEPSSLQVLRCKMEAAEERGKTKMQQVWVEFWRVDEGFAYGNPVLFSWDEKRQAWTHCPPAGKPGGVYVVDHLGMRTIAGGAWYASDNAQEVCAWMNGIACGRAEEKAMAARELKRWKAIAAWLASCHAATVFCDGMLKSCSVSRRKRFVAICKTAVSYLSGSSIPHAPYPLQNAEDGDVETAMRWCAEAAEELEKAV